MKVNARLADATAIVEIDFEDNPIAWKVRKGRYSETVPAQLTQLWIRQEPDDAKPHIGGIVWPLRKDGQRYANSVIVRHLNPDDPRLPPVVRSLHDWVDRTIPAVFARLDAVRADIVNDWLSEVPWPEGDFYDDTDEPEYTSEDYSYRVPGPLNWRP